MCWLELLGEADDSEPSAVIPSWPCWRSFASLVRTGITLETRFDANSVGSLAGIVDAKTGASGARSGVFRAIPPPTRLLPTAASGTLLGSPDSVEPTASCASATTRMGGMKFQIATEEGKNVSSVTRAKNRKYGRDCCNINIANTPLGSAVAPISRHRCGLQD